MVNLHSLKKSLRTVWSEGFIVPGLDMPKLKVSSVFLLFITGIVFGVFFSTSFKPHYDINQMFDRGVELARHNNLISYGNASSAGMGSVPGPLSALVVGIPLKIFWHPISPLILLHLFHILSLFLLWLTVKDEFKKHTLWMFFFFIWLNPWRTTEIYLWNPSYMFLATSIHLYTSKILSTRKSFWASFFHIFSLWFGTQFHNSAIVLYFLSFGLWVRKKVSINWWGVSSAIVLGLAALIPYFQELFNNPDIAPVVRDSDSFLFRGLIYVFPVLKSVTYWLRFTTTVFPKPIFHQMDFQWMGSFQAVFSIFFEIQKYFLAVLTALISIRWGLKYYKAEKKKWMDDYIGLAFLSVLGAAALSPIDFNFWHLFVVFPIAVLSYLRMVDLVDSKKIAPWFWGGLIYVCIYSCLAIIGSEKYGWDASPEQHFYETYGEQRILSNEP